jgi:hypothetical protein
MNHISEVMLKPIHILLLRVKPLEISGSADEYASDKDAVLLVADEFGLTEELGVHQYDLPSYREEIECPDEFESPNSDHCCTECQLSSGSLY